MSASPLDTDDAISPEHLAEAGVWIARLHGESRGKKLEEGFQTWLQASPLNARAFEAATDVWQEAGNLRRIIPLELTPRRRWLSRPAMAVAMLIVMAAALGAWFLVPKGIETGVGEQRTLNLEDGTHVFLNTSTRVVVKYDRKARRIELKHGEALFNVAPRSAWPFIVTAGDRQVRALGTSFVVRRDPGQLAVVLVEGKVLVSTVSGDAGTLLEPGERLVFAAAQTASKDRPELQAALAWRHGQVILDDTPLSDAVAEMNRYSSLTLVVERSEARRLLINGLFQAGDSKSFAEAVALTYGLKVVSEDKRIVLTGIPTPH